MDRVTESDESGFGAYVRDARPRLLRFAVVLTDDRELAQDLVQDVLMRAQQYWPRIAPLDRPHAYVRRMLVNEVTSWRRKWSRIEARPDDELDTATPDPTDAVDRRDFLLRELGRLPVKQRAAVVMRYLEDMADDVIAEILECSESTVRVHIHRALQRLRVDLDPAARAAANHSAS